MTRVVTVVREPHIGISLVNEKGEEIYDPKEWRGKKAIWDCDLMVYVQYDDGGIDLFSAQYDAVLCDGTADDLYLRPLNSFANRMVDLEDVEEYVEAKMLVEGEDEEESRKYVIDLLKKHPSTSMDDEVREKYGIPKP